MQRDLQAPARHQTTAFLRQQRRETGQNCSVTLLQSLLMAQKTGAFIVSNSYRSPGGDRPSFDELILEPAQRQNQWERIKASCADGRLCRIAATADGQTQITDAKLTKQLLMSLPTGVRVTSNVYRPSSGMSVPWFAEFVAPPDDREAQWQRIRAEGMNGKTCRVFESRVAYEHWISGW